MTTDFGLALNMLHLSERKQTQNGKKQTSVSGRGMNTGGASFTSILWKSHFPMMYCRGILFSRWLVIVAMRDKADGGTSVLPATAYICRKRNRPVPIYLYMQNHTISNVKYILNLTNVKYHMLSSQNMLMTDLVMVN